MRARQAVTPWLEGLSVPVVCAPMFLVSGPELVLSACKSGLVGAFPAPNTRTPEQLDDWMTQIGAGVAAMRSAGVRVGP